MQTTKSQPKRTVTGARTLERGLEVLRAVAESRHPLTATEIAEELGFNRSTAWRLLSVLKRGEYVAQDPETLRYSAGPTVLRLVRFASDESLLIDCARPVLEELEQELGEAAALTVVHEGEVHCILEISPPHVLTVSWIGRTSPAHASPTGRIALAHMPEPQLERYLSQPLEGFTDKTPTSPRALRRMVKEIRERGWDMDSDCYVEGITAIGAPVFGPSGDAIAFAGAWWPTFRVPDERIPPSIEAVVKAARAISLGLRRIGT